MEWLIGAVVLVAIIVAYLFLARRIGSKPVFIATYRSQMKIGNKTPAEALEHTIRFFGRRAPFDKLTEEDIQYIVTACDGADVISLSEVWHECDKRGDVRLAKSFAFFMDYEQRQAQGGSIEDALVGTMKFYIQGKPWFDSLTEEDMRMWAKTFAPIPAAVGDAFVEVDGLRDGALLKDKELMARHLRTRLSNLGINLPSA